MVKLTIDNKPVEVDENASILEAAIKAGIDIPTLCYNPELTIAAACRLCVVEVGGNSQSVLVTACETPVSAGMVINTKSAKALAARRLAAEVLLAQNPNSPKLHKIARDLGLEKPRFNLPQKDCVLCQLCTRTCEEVVGAGAITFMARGLGRTNLEAQVVWSADRCIACASCAYICPTGAVTMKDENGIRSIITPAEKMDFKMKACSKCGSLFAPEKQLEFMARRSGLPLEKFNLCPDCRD
jgi:bidirectional [NiFe] hydrogenase diaphorase subunit